MKFKGTIIITDPCYIMRAEHHGTTPITEDDWRACDCGQNMEVLGIKHYICESTIYGDWGCTTYKVDTDPVKIIDIIAESYAKGDCEIDFSPVTSKIGNFCADAGLVSVFLLDEVRKYNPDIDKWIKEHPWCVTTIEDFDGNVEYYVDKNSEAHIYGTGSINFFTTQTSL